jgi:hypothetical protein
VSERGFRIPLWLLVAGAIVIPLLGLLEAFIYYPAELRSGDLPIDADSIAIPLSWAVTSAPFNILVLLLFTLPAIYHYGGDATWKTLDRSHPWRASLSILLYGVPAVFLVGDLIYSFMYLPLYNASIVIVSVPMVLWLLMLRGAMAAPRRTTDGLPTTSVV